MKSQDLKIEELIDFSEGWLSLKGRRLVIQDIHAFTQLRKDLLETIGIEQTRGILTRFGFFWGQADAAAMKRIFEWDNLREWILAGPRLQSIQGIARCVVKSLELDENSRNFRMEIIWNDCFEAREHLIEFGKGDQPMCWIMAGYSSGYATFCLKRDIYFMEEKCRARGDRVCMATGMEREAWGERISDYLRYFQSEDIYGKIIRLTEDLKKKQMEIERQRKRIALVDPTEAKNLIGVRSRSFRQVIATASQVAHFNSTVLIMGESGTGKEVLARYIHKHSHRNEGSFITVNCGALPDTLLESELFGHTAGAFTGANKDRIGLFEEAKKGTIFLDEIGDISPAMQIKLLRVLQEKEILRLGENRPRKIDVRIIAATNRDLEKAILEGIYREDLYYRLAVVVIQMPLLKERKEDILPLARYFVKRFSRKLRIPRLRLDASTLDTLLAYEWPGNVRELENVLERAAIFSLNGVIMPENLPSNIYRASGRPKAVNPLEMTLAQVEEEHIKNVLELTHQSKSKAAKALGISTATLWRKLKKDKE